MTWLPTITGSESTGFAKSAAMNPYKKSRRETSGFLLFLHSNSNLFTRKLDAEAVSGGIAGNPDIAPVLLYNTFGNGQPQTIATVPDAGLIRTVKPLKYLFPLIFRNWLAGVGDRQHTRSSPLEQTHLHYAGIGIFGRII